MTDVTNPNAQAAADTTQTVVPSDATVETSAQQPAQTTEEVFDKDRAMATIRKLREIEKQATANQKELEQLRADKAKREEAELTELQRAQKQANEAAAQIAKLQADLWRRDVVAETGIPSILADRIQGATKEDMLADAKKLAEALPKKTAPGLPATNPGNAQQGETQAQLRQRIYGERVDPFAGGGVVWPTDKQ